VNLKDQLAKLIEEYGEEKVLTELGKLSKASVLYTYADIDAEYFGWAREKRE
jgi:hypothetical protein